jgi:Protein of unknown function (DUF1559)
LLLPAINMAREAARKAQCSNNLKQLVLAIDQFDQARTGYPAARTFWNNANYKRSANYPVTYTTSGARAQTLSWVHEILPYIEKQDLRTQVENNMTSNLVTGNPGYVWDIFGRLNAVLCPSDETDQPYSNNQSSSGLQIKYSQLSYGINTGVWDNMSPTPALNGTLPGFDYPQNGVFETRIQGSSPTPDGLLRFKKPGKADVVRGDGASNTFLLVENSDLEEWNDPATEIHVGVIWDDNFSDNSTYGGAQLLNKYPTGVNNAKPDTLYNIYNQGQSTACSYARPLSNHPTGFMAAFCGGNIKFVSESIDYLVYCRLMTSEGKKYLKAGIPSTMSPNPVLPIQQMQSLGITEDSF